MARITLRTSSQIVGLLLAAGARLEAMEPLSSWTSLQLASHCGRREVVGVLLAAGADIEAKPC